MAKSLGSVGNFVSPRFANFQCSTVMSPSLSASSFVFNWPPSYKYQEQNEIKRGRRNSFSAEPEFKGKLCGHEDLATVRVVDSRCIRGLSFQPGNTSGDYWKNPKISLWNRPRQCSLGRMQKTTANVAKADGFAAATAQSSASKANLPGFSHVFPACQGIPAASVATNATGGGIMAEPSSVRKIAKENDFVPDAKLARIRQLFEEFSENGIDAYIVPSEDAHQSEFMADCYMRRSYISGFTGSAGSAVIAKDKAALWTDGRYFLQAESQLGHEWTLMRAGTTGVPLMSEWIRDNLTQGSRVGIDPFLFSCDAAEELKRTLAEKDHSLVLIYDSNLVDEVWGSERPSLPSTPLRVHDIKFAGIGVSTKLTNLRSELVLAGSTAIVVTMLDEVAWLLNLRGGDILHSPVTYAYVIVQLESATLYVDESKVTSEVAEHLTSAGVEVCPYADLVPDIKRLALQGSKLWLDSSKVSVAIKDAFNDACVQYYSNINRPEGQGRRVDCPVSQAGDGKGDKKPNGPAAIYRLSPITLAKALKNAAELEGMKQAHLRDAAALAEFWAWLEQKIVEEKQSFTEVEVADILDKFRAKQPGFLETSFDTISGSGPNGAICHYRAHSDTCGQVDEHKLLLLDSGAQYIDGTTDITRTVHFGVPTSRERKCFTCVLQGHIAVDRAIFPEGTPGFVLDVLARTSLWKIGLDYRHGTGHGVGAALNVHEGPQGISSRFGNMTGLQAGMIVSNEPGYYEDHAFGIRIENLVIVREVETESRFGGTTFLGFDRLSFVPIQAKMLELSLLSEDEIDWLNDYHAEVWEKVSPLVDGDTREWLRKNTQPISSKCATNTGGK